MPDGFVFDPTKLTPEEARQRAELVARIEAELGASFGRLADGATAERVALESALGPRSFKAFFRMCWPAIDPAHLLWNWHIDLLCDEMELVARRVHQEAVFCVPPRSLKSQILSVAFPAWVWTWHPSAKFITGSNEMTLATRDAVKCRRLVESDWYQRRWGPDSAYVRGGAKLSNGKPHPGVRLTSDQNNKTLYETTAGGHRFCCTPGSNVTGHGGDFVICDDPHPTQKAESEAERSSVTLWWFEAIPTRLNEPDRGVKLVIQQRVHREDLAGLCIDKGYHKVVLPMEFDPEHPHLHPRDQRKEKGELLHPERVNKPALAKLKAALGPYGVAGQLQQQPSAREGILFQRGWFSTVEAYPAEVNGNLVRRWDLAGTVAEPGKDPDWTAGLKMGKDSLGRFYVLDVIRFRDDPGNTEMAIKAVAQQDGIGVKIVIPQDPGQAGKSQAQRLIRFLSPHSVEAVQETGDKATRARGVIAQARMGNIFLVRGKWNEAFLDELADFPNGKHDDQVDAVSGALVALSDTTTGMLDFLAAFSN